MERTRHGSIVAAKDQVSCDLRGETAILHVRTGIYYGLDPVGTFVWNLIQKPTTFDQLRDSVLSEYDVESDQCERDLCTLLEELAAAQLIEFRDAPAP
jgi:hypothetical protein